MKSSLKAGISAICMALILFLGARSASASLPLTETIQGLADDMVDFSFKEEVYQVKKTYRTDILGLGIGVLSDLSLWFRFQYLHDGIIKSEKGDVGDFIIKAKYYIGDYFGDSMHCGFLFQFRIPTGKNAYSSPDWRNLSLGKNEIRIGPYFKFDIRDSWFLHLNLFYTFREGKAEDFYGGFSINIFTKETWSNFFGLNPFSAKSFLSYKRLKDDYLSLSLAFNTNRLLPVVPFIEVYGSIRPSSAKIETRDVRIEAAGINPTLLLSAGARYFFNKMLYAGLYAVYNPLGQKDFIKAVYGLEVSLQY